MDRKKSKTLGRKGKSKLSATRTSFFIDEIKQGSEGLVREGEGVDVNGEVAFETCKRRRSERDSSSKGKL